MKLLSIAFAGAFLMAPGLASAGSWDIDTSHTSAKFSVRHMVVSWTHGKMGPVTGKLTYDPKNPAKSKVQATIDVSGIDTDDEKRDEHLRGPDFFDAKKFPKITFISKKVKVAGNKLKVTGELTIKGVSKTVTLDVEKPAKVIKGPWGFWRTGTVATTVINRKDFGIEWNKALDSGGVAVGNEVKIEIDLEFTTKTPIS